MIFTEHLCVRHITHKAINFPTFRERTERNPGIILNDHPAVFEEKTADTAETFAVHKIGGGFEETESRPLLDAPAEEGALPTRQIGLEVRQCLPAAGAGQRNLHPVRLILA